MLCSFDRSGEF